METPLYKLQGKELDTVYSPSEDSFLLIDALESDLEMLKSIRPLTCLEIGSGSGVVITALGMAFRKLGHRACYLAVDINSDACRVTKKTALLNSIDVELLQMDLLSCIRSDFTFDIVVFNPPYVVTENGELSGENILYKAWAGGTNGRKVMERVFGKISEVLSRTGMFYLLVIKENDPDYILNAFEKLNMRGDVVAERKIRGEHLYVLRFQQIPKNCT